MSRVARPARAPRAVPAPRSTAVTCQPRRTSRPPPRPVPGGPDRAATDRTRRPARRHDRLRRSAGRSCRTRSRPASPGSAARRRPGRRVQARRRRSAATAAGDVNTPPARQCQAGDRSRTMTSRPSSASRAARTAPAGPPPTTATATPRPRGVGPTARPGRPRRRHAPSFADALRVRRLVRSERSGVGTAAIAYRWPNEPRIVLTGDSPAARSIAAISPARYARRTDSGASLRV